MMHFSKQMRYWTTQFRRLALFLVGLVAIGLIGVSPAHATGVYDLPTVSAGSSTWIVDQADLLSRINYGKINSSLEKLAQETGNEVRFITIHRLDYGETAQSLAQKIVETWFPDPETQAHQTVLVLDNVTNDTAIYAGADSKALLTPEIAESVAEETVMVPLRHGNKYNQAFLDASDRLVAVLSGQPDPGPPVVEDVVQTEGTFTTAEETDGGSATVMVIVLLAAATIIPMATYYLYQILQS